MTNNERAVLAHIAQYPFGHLVPIDEIVDVLPDSNKKLTVITCRNLVKAGYIIIRDDSAMLSEAGYNLLEKINNHPEASNTVTDTKTEAKCHPHIEDHIVYKILRDHGGWIVAIVALVIGVLIGQSTP